MCSNIGIPEPYNFPFGTNGKLMVLGVPIHKHFRVLYFQLYLDAMDVLSEEDRQTQVLFHPR